MTIVIDALQYLGYVLIFPGFLFCFLAGMLLCGIDRKLVAKMQKACGTAPAPAFLRLLQALRQGDNSPRPPLNASALCLLAGGPGCPGGDPALIPVFGFTPFPASGISSLSSTCC